MSVAINGRTVNFVEFGAKNGRLLGTFRQAGAATWVETDQQGDMRFRFDESHRDDWSVYLHDASRKMDLMLDLHRKMVLQGSARQELYSIVSARSFDSSVPILALKAFNQWYGGGGESRAALPIGSMRSLDLSIRDCRTLIKQLARDLGLLRKNWTRVEATDTAVLSDKMLGRVVADLAVIGSQTKNLLAKSGHASVLWASADQLVRDHMNDDQRLITKATGDLAATRTRQEKARNDLRAAKREIERQNSGGKAWENAFETVFTFGAVNHVQDAVDHHNRIVERHNKDVAKIKADIAIYNRAREEHAEGNSLLRKLSSLISALTEYKNILAGAAAATREAHKDATKADGVSSQRLGEFYRKQAGKEMRELFQWIEAFDLAR